MALIRFDPVRERAWREAIGNAHARIANERRMMACQAAIAVIWLLDAWIRDAPYLLIPAAVFAVLVLEANGKRRAARRDLGRLMGRHLTDFTRTR